MLNDLDAFEGGAERGSRRGDGQAGAGPAALTDLGAVLVETGRASAAEARCQGHGDGRADHVDRAEVRIADRLDQPVMANLVVIERLAGRLERQGGDFALPEELEPFVRGTGTDDPWESGL